MPSLFGSGSSSLLGQQLGSLASLSSVAAPQRWDEGLSAGLMDPTQPQFGGIAKLSGQSIGAGQQDPLTGSFGGVQKLKGADIGAFGMGPGVSPQTGRTGSTMGGAGNVGGDWAGVERWSDAINQASSRYGVPTNLIKAIMKLESGGDPNAVGAPGVWGPMQVHSGVWGQGPWSHDPVANIMKGVEILRGNYDQYGTWDMAIRAYLGFGTDMYGTTDEKYLEVVKNNWNALNNASGGAGLGSGGWTVSPTVPNVGNSNGNRVLQEAVKYVGVRYTWGGIPGRGEDPWAGGWDCSGFTYWLDQNYGSGNLPMGSHYQYQYAQANGMLNMNPSALQPGDLVFFDTGWQGGAGAELNRAGHVGVYLGNDQFIHAANASQGTIVSQFSTYGGGQFIGGMRSAFSGGGAVSGGFGSTGGGGFTGNTGSTSGGALSILQRMRGY